MICEWIAGATILALLFAGFYGIEHFGELPEDLDDTKAEDQQDGK